jgi:hypothetical protein
VPGWATEEKTHWHMITEALEFNPIRLARRKTCARFAFLPDVCVPRLEDLVVRYRDDTKMVIIITFTWSGPRWVADYIESLAVGDAVVSTTPYGCLTRCNLHDFLK